MYKILKFISITNFCLFLIFGCAIDSESLVPFIGCVVTSSIALISLQIIKAKYSDLLEKETMEI